MGESIANRNDAGEGRSPRAPFRLTVLLCATLALFFVPALSAQAKNSCLDCHSKLDAPFHVDLQKFTQSIHAQKGITCVACHGGDSTSDDMSVAMSPAKGFKDAPARAQVPGFCARCHANAAYMRGFNPSLRTDQYSQYLTSIHGQRLAKGDDKVAVCVDCHGVHDILPPNDPRSSVYPTNVAQTCGHCHADAAYMKPYKIPTNQLALYNTSVHHADLVDKGDVSAPTCSTCHGSHGAAPPGVDSVVNVCSTCHVFQAQLFDSGPHKAAFQQMNLPGCVTCHSNHGIQHPTDAFIGVQPGAVCIKCHSSGDPGFAVASKIHGQLVLLDTSIARSREILGRAEQAGVEVGPAQLELTQARDDLTKARVSVHSVELQPVNQNVDAGLKVTEATYQAGVKALAEARYRRKGLVVSLALSLLVLIGIVLMIRKIESQPQK
ncbi:MAG TPA: cytochrome c3 family protein [Terriglobales bacterium]|nr:cytochrome c3 family protein [Terriglobales bacterium]